MTIKHLLALLTCTSALAFGACIDTSVDDEPEIITTERSPAPPPLCFVCDLDGRIKSCSSNTAFAQRACERSCIECDEFAGHTDCFQGSCEPELVSP